MFNRRKFLAKGFLATLGAILFPKYVFAENKNNTILDNKSEPHNWQNTEINLAWIGHSTILINFYGTIILTDPVLLDKIGVSFIGLSFGPSRLTPPALSVDEIPKPDIILLSHAHMDHTDYPTLKNLTKKFPNQIDLVNAYLTSDVTSDLKWKSVSTLDWNDKIKLHGITFTAYEVEHFGWRFPWEKDRSRGYMKDSRSYNAYLLEKNGKTILFDGRIV